MTTSRTRGSMWSPTPPRPRPAADAAADPRRQHGRPRRGRGPRGGAGRRLSGRLLLDHQPRDRRPARRPLGAGRAPRDGLRPAGAGRPGAHHPGVRRARTGDTIVCGAAGVRVVLPPADAQHAGESSASCPRRSAPRSRRHCWSARSPSGSARSSADGGKVLWVAGPAVVHTGASPAMVALVEAGFVDVLFAGNALATHDIEAALFGTSLGVDLAQGRGVEHGHEHHIRAINTIRKAGSIAAAVEQGVLTSGVMHALVRGTQGVRAGRFGARRRPAARRLHRRDRGAARDARGAAGRRLRDHGRDDAALDRHRQPAAGLDPAGLRGHQPGDGDQAGRPRVGARRSASSPTSGSSSSSSRSTSSPSTATAPARSSPASRDQRSRARSAAPTRPASGPSLASTISASGR